MEVTELSDEQKAEFKEAMSEIYEDVKRGCWRRTI